MRLHAQLALTLALALPSMLEGQQTQPTTLPSSVYLFSSFRGNGEDGLHLAWSTDGLKWTAIANDRSFLKPQVGIEKIMRDPSIFQAPDRTFHLVWTCGWYERSIGYASSKDLIHWSEQKAIPVMEHEPTARNSWAPEIVYDPTWQHFIVFWSTTIPGRFPATDNVAPNKLNHRIFCTRTRDFESFTPAELFYDPGFNVIDATMIQANGKFHLVVKDETPVPVRKHLRVATGNSIEGPFDELSEPFTQSWVEGPSVLKVGDQYIVYYDMYRQNRYGAMRSKDLKTWQDVTAELSMPAWTKHGTAIQVNRDILVPLLDFKPPPATQP